MLLDMVALVALVVAGRLVLAQIGDAQSIGGKLGQQVFQALLYWRAFNLAVPRLAAAQHARGPHRPGRRCRRRAASWWR